MNGLTMRPRTRGPRRGRGVRVRGGRGAVMAEVGAGLAYGSRGGRGTRPGPSSVDELLIQDIDEMPHGQAFERPLHPKRPRVWQPPFNQSTTAGSNDSQVVSSQEEVQVLSPPVEIPPASLSLSASPAPSFEGAYSPSISVPSPAVFVECGGSGPSTPSGSRPVVRSRRVLQDDEIAQAINYGSEPSSGESDDEELAAPFIPRSFQALMETPLDEEEEPVTDIIGPAIPPSSGSDLTAQPISFLDFSWEAFPINPIPPELRRECFSISNVGPTAPYVDPYDIFVDIWDQQFMEHIAVETNRYAQQVAENLMERNELAPNSRITAWRETNPNELYTLFGIILAMGVVVKSNIKEYWCSTQDIFYTPGFSAHMSFSRFLLLCKCLHFNNNNDMCARNLSSSEAKLYKIQPVITHLNKKFQSRYVLDRNISLDESLLMWKGWLDINQFVPNKAAAVGIKTYEVCESQTGYLWRFEVHAHKRSPPQQQEDPLNASTPAIVLRLLQGLENRGHTVWMDNFYNSPVLARRLKSIGFDCVGTLRTNRKFVPQAINSLNKRNMQPGQVTGVTSGDIDVMVWRDSNRVAMISTYHGNGVSRVGQSTKPIVVLDYNIMMGGVDKKDQMLAMFPIERKRTKVWYKKLFRRLLNVSVLNSYIIHRKSASSPLNHRNFRITLTKTLLSKHCSSRLIITPQPAPLDFSHRLADYPLGHHQRQRRQCQVCKRRTHTYCAGCSKTVCKDSCFLSLHSQ